MPQSPVSPAQRSHKMAFGRSRFITRRLKRMQTKSASSLYTSENKENCTSICYPETNYVSSSSRESLNEIILESNVAEVVKYCPKIAVEEADDQQQQQQQQQEDLLSSTSYGPYSDSRSDLSVGVTIIKSEEIPLFKNDPIFGLNTPIIESSLLLEEIDESFAIKSLKEILEYAYFSVNDFRTRSRLCRVMPFSPYTKKPKIPYLMTVLDENKAKKELDRLKIELGVQEMLEEQAQNALKECNKHSSSYLNAEKMLLLASIKCNAVKKEIERVSLLDFDWNEPDSKSGYLCINEIVVTIDKSSLGDCSICKFLIIHIRENINCMKKKSTSLILGCPAFTRKPQYFLLDDFICVAVERDNIRASDFVTGSSEGEITFYSELHFLYLRVNFKIKLFIYAIPNRETKTKLFLKSPDILHFSPKGKAKKGSEITHNFILVSSTDICLKDITGSNYMYLTTDHKHGQSIKVHIKGDVHLSTLHEGFLSVKYIEFKENETDLENVDVGVWDLRWFRLTALGLQGWNYPLQIDQEPPSEYIVLSQCISTVVEAADPFLCVRKFTLTFKLKSPKNVKRIYCSTDCQESFDEWCEKLNLAITTLRAWNQTEN